MKLRNLALATCLAAVGVTAAFAQAKEQFFPALPYRTGPYAPNGVPWANGYVDYLKLVNARGGINGVKIIFGALIVWFLIVEPHGLAKLWSTGKQKLRLWPFPH